MGGGNKRPIGIEKRKAFIHNPNSKKTEKIAQMPNEGLCQDCHDTIEWRKKYRKYKPLSMAGKCAHCTQRKVTRAYHELCEDCVKKLKVCAKCHKAKEIVAEITDPKDRERDELKLKHALYMMTESDRRTFYRELEKEENPEKKKKNQDNEEEDDDSDYSDEEEEEEEKEIKKLTKKTNEVRIFNNDKVKEVLELTKKQQQQLQDKDLDQDEESYKKIKEQFKSQQPTQQLTKQQDDDEDEDEEDEDEFDDEDFDDEDFDDEEDEDEEDN
ncbi:hypothetical protein DFA_08186 [Cavenderia fasciculata]|uniref:Uncharacterized protein n=1 Tax=Cavenderia fasciculata TaxID=261658 RepID=F4Q5E0_CACFS|nr:uncharacterized protein DFA_08186 [Cavenderia fasciculata]EGG17199.1 hypothetical protein DFA_08186 [Cavenderia fasciculata]|eukprot:XP_004355683.1 hypothetical protein DFA_08186 [Cavenderia fasciculata]